MLIFYDWEFFDDGKTIEPISVGMVTGGFDGEPYRELYLVNKDFDWDTARDWLKENVQPNLYLDGSEKIPLYNCRKAMLGTAIHQWLQDRANESKEQNKLVGWFASYDFVCTSQRFGPLIERPKALPFWTYDLKQWCDDLGNPQLPEKSKFKHNALMDALWNQAAYLWLKANYDHPAWTPK